jgi:glyoxylase-like metal-dependent hydrolase (beta-lactamase superfamily II)
MTENPVRKLWALALLFLLAGGGWFTLAQQSQEADTSAPFALEDLLALLAAGVTPGRLAGLVKDRGVTFDFTADAERKLRLVGADDTLLLEVSKASARRPPKPEPAPQPPPQPPTPQPTPPVEQKPGAFDIIRVADGVYAAIGKNTAPMLIGSNAAIIVNEDDVVVVDSHYTPSAARALLAEIKQLTDKPVRYIVNTHWHNDHTQGNQAYLNVFPGGAEFISSHLTREDIEKKAIPYIQQSLESVPQSIAQAEEQLAAGLGPDGQPLTDEEKAQRRAQLHRQKAYLEELRSLEITLPTLTFERSLVLHKDARPIHIFFFHGGHTRGDVVVYLPKEKILVAGDLVTAGLPFPRDSYPNEWAKSLNAIAGLDFDQLIPGHGPVQKGNNHVKRLAQLLDSIVQQVRSAVDKGLSLDDTKKALNVEPFRQAITGGDAAQNRNFDARIPTYIERVWREARGELKD